MSRLKRKATAESTAPQQTRKRKKAYKGFQMLDTAAILATVTAQIPSQDSAVLWNEPGKLALQLKTVFEAVFPALTIDAHVQDRPQTIPATSRQ